MTMLGETCTIQTSTSLTAWEAVLTFEGCGGPLLISDPNCAACPRRLHRVKMGR